MSYDVVVIGSGPGGYVAAIRAVQLGLKTACVEKEETLGGTCLNVGCIPSKALLQSSEYYGFVEREAKEHGIEVKEVKPNLKQMMQRKDEVVKSLVDGVAGIFKRKKIDSIKGTAKFVSPNKIEVENKTIEAKNFILATGSEPIELPFLKFDEKLVVSSTGALSLPKIPKKMLVIGAGVIGVELASVYNRLGSEVTIIEMLDHITPGMDEDIRKALNQSLKKQGINFHLSSKVVEADVKKNKVTLKVEQGNIVTEFSGDVVLVAIGRKPYTKGLGLDAIGVELTQRGFVNVNRNFQTSHSHIYAVGDLVEGPMLAHKASEEGIAAANTIAGQRGHVNYMAIPNIIYTHPEAVSLGLTEQEAKQAGLQLKIGTCSFKANARARCAGDTEGLVKVIGEATSGVLIGMHIAGPHASEMIGEGVMAIEKRATLDEIERASHAHPTLCEAIKEAVQSALGRAIHL